MSVILSPITFRQCFFVPAPTWTEQDLPDQAGRVFIVTGGYTGVGKELVKILYKKNGIIYVAGRSQEKAESAISEIQNQDPSSDGRLEFLKLDLADPSSIKDSVTAFSEKEQRLDVLTNNAGLLSPPKGSVTKQGHELQMGTNCLGPFLLTLLLRPLMEKTAASSPPGSVRVTWAASVATMNAPRNGGVEFDAQSNDPKTHNSQWTNYAQTKACNVLLAREFQRRYSNSGIISNAFNPGNLRTELQRNNSVILTSMTNWTLHDARLGGLTELFAGWSPDAGTPENVNKYIGPWGRFVGLREDIEQSTLGPKFWEWCEDKTKAFM